MTARARGLKVRTGQGMVVLSAAEAGELLERLGQVRASQPASETLAVSANARTSDTFTDVEKAAVLEALTRWLEEPTGHSVGDGPLNLRSALAHDLGLE